MDTTTMLSSAASDCDCSTTVSFLDYSQSTISNSSPTLADLPFTTDLPLLRRSDLEIGRMLGRGRYSQVHAITSIRFPQQSRRQQQQQQQHQQTTGASAIAPTTGTTRTTCSVREDDHDDEQEEQQQAQPGCSAGHDDNDEQDQCYVMKHLQSKNFRNRTHRRFAKDLTNACADLVLEAMYLSKLQHPHIIHLRGLTLGGTSVLKRPGAQAEDYFLILDRMEETLDRRIYRWRQLQQKKHQPSTCTTAVTSDADAAGKNANHNTVALVLTKTRYALQIADAMSYLHDHQVLYRDLKPENCGFLAKKKAHHALSSSASSSSFQLSHSHDEDHDILQLFDFGLARELDEPVENATRLYTLSASGTRRYMAPEIFNPPFKYNYKADTYSFAMVLYEMLSLQKPFADFTCQSHDELVCRLGGRPRLSDITWPHDADKANGAAAEMDRAMINTSRQLAKDLVTLLPQAWTQDLHQRLTMVQVCERLQEILKTHEASTSSSKNTTTKRQSQQQRLQQLHYQQQQRQWAASDSGGSLSEHFLTQTGYEISAILKKKTSSTSEMTVATESMASDSELDDDVSYYLQQPHNTHRHRPGSRSGSSGYIPTIL